MTEHEPILLIDGSFRYAPEGDSYEGFSDGMYKAIYDPNGKEADIFDRQNHEETQTADTISDAGDGLVLPIADVDVSLALPNTLAPGDHFHSTCASDMMRAMYDAVYGLGLDAFNRANHKETQTLETIEDAGNSASLDVGPTEGGVPYTVSPGIHFHTGLMELSTYDPNSLGLNIYDRNFHIGVQAHTTIEGLGSSALLGVGLNVGEVAPNDHTHEASGSDIFMRQSLYNPGELIGDAFDRTLHINTQTLDSILDADLIRAGASDGVRGIVPAPLLGEQFFYLRNDATWHDMFLDDIPAMRMEVYDPDLDGVVNNTQKLNGENQDFYLNRTNHTSTQSYLTIIGMEEKYATQVSDSGEEMPTLDEFGKLSLDDLPEDLPPGVVFGGSWDSKTNTPPMPDPVEAGVGTYYIVSAADEDPANNYELNGEQDWGIGDWVMGNGQEWFKVDHSSKVKSVLTYNGDVTFLLSDLDDVSLNPDTPPDDGSILLCEGASYTAKFIESGDMYMVDYDTDENTIVDDTDLLGAEEPEFYLDRENHTGTQPYTSIDGLADVFMPLADVPANMPGLDEDGGIPEDALPDDVIKPVKFMGEWNQNAPLPGPSDDNLGNYWRVTADSDDYRTGDWAYNEAGSWTRVAHSEIIVSVQGVPAVGDIIVNLEQLTDVDTSSLIKDHKPLAWDGANWAFGTSAAGDMSFAVYDTGEDGVVDDVDNLDGKAPDYYLGLGNKSGTLDYTKIADLGPGAILDLGTDVPGQGSDVIAIVNHTHDASEAGDMKGENNLSELTDIPLALTRLGLEDVAEISVGTGADDFAAGDHSHTLNSLLSTPAVANQYPLWDGYSWIPTDNPWDRTYILDVAASPNFTPASAKDRDMLFTGTGYWPTTLLPEYWLPMSPAEITPGVLMKLQNLSDIESTISSASTGDQLTYTGSQWGIPEAAVAVAAPPTDTEIRVMKNRLASMARTIKDTYTGWQQVDFLKNADNILYTTGIVHDPVTQTLSYTGTGTANFGLRNAPDAPTDFSYTLFLVQIDPGEYSEYALGQVFDGVITYSSQRAASGGTNIYENPDIIVERTFDIDNNAVGFGSGWYIIYAPFEYPTAKDHYYAAQDFAHTGMNVTYHAIVRGHGLLLDPNVDLEHDSFTNLGLHRDALTHLAGRTEHYYSLTGMDGTTLNLSSWSLDVYSNLKSIYWGDITDGFTYNVVIKPVGIDGFSFTFIIKNGGLSTYTWKYNDGSDKPIVWINNEGVEPTLTGDGIDILTFTVSRDQVLGFITT